MATKPTKPVAQPTRLLSGAEVTLRVVRRYARQVAALFQPDKIILFGSYAYGTPDCESDVDLLVVMPCRNSGDAAFKIRCAIDPPFAAHIVVRTPHAIDWRLREGDSFLREVVTKGKLIYKSPDARLGAKGGGRVLSGNGGGVGCRHGERRPGTHEGHPYSSPAAEPKTDDATAAEPASL